jgi:hypothetical protein
MIAVTIPRRFRGPADSANGGYACAVLGKHLHNPASVRLHKPPPLDTELSIDLAQADGAALLHAEQIIARAAAAPIDADVPPPVTVDVAQRASRAYRWFSGHPFPECFVCGPERAAGDGLRIFAGPVPERRIVAAPWTPDASVCNAAGECEPEVVWSVLDCPSWFALLEFQENVRYSLLGQLTVRLLRPPRLGESCVVIGWPRGRDGRKLHSGAALYSAAGELLGHSQATWIELSDAQLNGFLQKDDVR